MRQKMACSLSAMLAIALCVGIPSPAVGVNFGGRTLAAQSSSANRIILHIDRKAARPGGSVRVKIENDSSREIAYGLEFELARSVSGHWRKLPGQPVFAPRFSLPPAGVGPWQWISVPRQASSGRYRVRKWVEPSGSAKRRVPIIAIFDVVVTR